MTSNTRTFLVVGLGNPGTQHAADRHNVGFWFADQLAARLDQRFNPQTRFQAEACRGQMHGQSLRIIKPLTFMNRSGQSVRQVLDYYDLSVAHLLVVHDELDLPPGTARFKAGGGHGGHNGLRDIGATCGNEFTRLRLGIGHPGHKDLVTDYVLQPPGRAERVQILEAMEAGLSALEVLVGAGLEKAMQQLHSATPRTDATGEFGPAG